MKDFRPASDTKMVHTARALVKVIRDPDAVRLKLCPRFDVDGGDSRALPEYDEGHGAVETNLDWREINLLIKELRAMRDRTFGRAE
jgi:hypothetical protein